MSSAETAGISAEAGGRGGAKGKATTKGAGGVCEKESEAGKALLSLLIDKEGGGGGGGGGGAMDPQLHGDEEQEDASPATLPSAHKRSGSPGMFGVRDLHACMPICMPFGD